MQKVLLIGNLGGDAVINHTNGKQVINFSVADTYKNSDGSEVTTWFSVAYWTESVKLAQYLKKGTLVFIEGTIRPKLYQTQNGEYRASLNVTAREVKLLGGNRNDDNQ